MPQLTVPSHDGGAIPVTTLTPDQPRGAGLLIVPAIFGVDPGTLEIAHRASSAGFPAWIINPFWRTVPDVMPPSRFEDALARARALQPGDVRADVSAVAAALRAQAGRVAVAGYCFGGPFALASAVDGPIDAVLVFHGSRLDTVLPELGGVRCPVSLHVGEKDGATPPELVAQVTGALSQVTVHHHAGARHGFAVPNHPGWDAAAAAAGHRDIAEVLDRMSV